MEPNHLYPIFRPFSQFVSQLPLADFSWSRADASSNTTNVRVWGMVGEGKMVLVWLQDECYRWPPQHEGKQCLQQSGISVVITGCHAGSSEFLSIFITPN